MLTVLTLLLALITAAVVVVVTSIKRSGREDTCGVGTGRWTGLPIYVSGR
jgi:hypothetical protein